MFSKFIIRNVGVLRAFDTPKAPQLSKLTLFYGRNGRGKSTLTSVLRAARDGCSSTVLARRSLGNGAAAPEVTLVTATGNVRFDNGKWNRKSAAIEVFDTAFITDNVYAGELIDLAHDRGLFSVIIGSDGVTLATHLERFNGIAKTSAVKLKEAETALRNDVPSDMGQDEFFALGPNAGYQQRLNAAEGNLKSVQQADKIAVLKPLAVLAMPELPADTAAVLQGTVADIDVTARQRLLDHFKRFRLGKQGEAWIAYGVDHIHDNACPFCGRDSVDAAGTVTLYAQIFGETYKAHLASITHAAALLEGAFGEGARTALSNTITSNAEAVARWGEFVSFDRHLPDMADFGPLVVQAHASVKALFDKKRGSPLDCIEATVEFAGIEVQLATASFMTKEYNEAVTAMNSAAEKTKTSAGITLDLATRTRDDARKRVQRHDTGVQSRIDAFYAAKKRDQRARRVRGQVQARLKKVNETAAEHYHVRVNHYLGRFGASFTISKITNSMAGNAGQSDYGLIIRGEPIARHRGRPADAIPTFRNTLSAGDKTTLALAFFLAKLDHDKALGNKTIVIDDPLSSHDSHRRRMTVEAIKELCARCLQVIVLSHDEFLLRDVQRRCVQVPSAAFQIDFAGGDDWSAASGVDLDKLCRAGHAKMVDEIVAFVDRRAGEPDNVVLKVRQVLETHYRRSFTAYFAHDLNLGQIVRHISVGGDSHPCKKDLTRLDNCNDATCDKHHGDDAIVVAKRDVDPDELAVIARDALQLIGARKP